MPENYKRGDVYRAERGQPVLVLSDNRDVLSGVRAYVLALSGFYEDHLREAIASLRQAGKANTGYYKVQVRDPNSGECISSSFRELIYGSIGTSFMHLCYRPPLKLVKIIPPLDFGTVSPSLVVGRLAGNIEGDQGFSSALGVFNNSVWNFLNLRGKVPLRIGVYSRYRVQPPPHEDYTWLTLCEDDFA